MTGIKIIVSPYLAQDQILVPPEIFAMLQDLSFQHDSLRMIREITKLSSPAASKPQDATATTAARNIKNDAGEAARKETE